MYAIFMKGQFFMIFKCLRMVVMDSIRIAPYSNTVPLRPDKDPFNARLDPDSMQPVHL